MTKLFYDPAVTSGETGHRHPYLLTDPAEFDQADDLRLKASEANALEWYNYEVDARDVEGITDTAFDTAGFELKVLGQGQTLTLRVDWDERVTLGPGTVIETLPWGENHDRIYQVYDPLTRTRYSLADT